jgi:multidrug efflux pump subunit AcrB
MYKNLILSMTCVMLAILLLLANFKMCLVCGICVVFTVIDVSGFMHFWNLTIDSVACTILVLAVGLCVDYSAHVCKNIIQVYKLF